MLLEFVGDVNGMKAEELLLQLRTTTVGFLGQSLLYHKLHTYIHITYIYICRRGRGRGRRGRKRVGRMRGRKMEGAMNNEGKGIQTCVCYVHRGA